MSKLPPTTISRFLAQCAIDRADQLPIAARAELYETIGDLFEGPESDEAKMIAFSLREIEKHQLTLGQMLATPAQ